MYAQISNYKRHPAYTIRHVYTLCFIFTQGYDGEFCQNDGDGCDIISCLEGQQCLDYPAPLVGAECACPDGYATNGDSKCVG